MKIMVLVPAFSQGSPVVGAFLFAKFLKENNIDVVFVSLDTKCKMGEDIIDRIKDAGLNYTCLDIKGWHGIVRHSSRLEKFCHEQEVTILLSYLIRPTIIAAPLKNIVKIASVRGMLNEDYAATYGKVLSGILVGFEMRALRKMHHVFAMTKPMKQWLITEKIEPKRLEVVNNFIDVNAVRSVSSGKISGNDELINIGIFSKYIQRKRIDIALKALSALVEDHKYTNIRLHIAGFGPMRPELEALASKLKIDAYVNFNSFLTSPLELMDKMDIVMLTSDSEGVPRCLLEAMALGKTCVSSNIKGVKDLIIDGETGYLFPAADAGALTCLLVNIIENKRYIAADKLINFVLKNYDVNSASKKMLSSIEKIYLKEGSLT